MRKKNVSHDESDEMIVADHCRWLSVCNNRLRTSSVCDGHIQVQDKKARVSGKYFWRGGSDELVKTHTKQPTKGGLARSNARRT